MMMPVLIETVAYLGPGLSGGLIAAVIGVLAAILMLVLGIVWYPAKRLFKRLRSRSKED